MQYQDSTNTQYCIIIFKNIYIAIYCNTRVFATGTGIAIAATGYHKFIVPFEYQHYKTHTGTSMDMYKIQVPVLECTGIPVGQIHGNSCLVRRVLRNYYQYTRVYVVHMYVPVRVFQYTVRRDVQSLTLRLEYTRTRVCKYFQDGTATGIPVHDAKDIIHKRKCNANEVRSTRVPARACLLAGGTGFAIIHSTRYTCTQDSWSTRTR